MRVQLIGWRDQRGALQDEWCSRSSDAVAMNSHAGQRGQLGGNGHRAIEALQEKADQDWREGVSHDRHVAYKWPRPPFREICSRHPSVYRRTAVAAGNVNSETKFSLPRVPRLDDRRFGSLSARPRAGTPANLIYSPQRGLSDISVLSRSCDGRKLNCERAVILRMSAEVALRKAATLGARLAAIFSGRPKG